MALWGKQDGAAPSQGTTVGVTNNNATVTGVGTAFLTDLDIGDTLIITSGTTTKNRVIAIASDTSLTLADVFTGSTAGTLAIANVKIQQQPKSTYQNSNTPKGKAALEEVFGVDVTEIKAGGDNTIAVAVANGGTGYLEVPGVAFSGGGGSSAAATATIAAGAVTAITVTNVGSAYTSAPTVSVDVPRRTIPTSGVAIATEQFTYATHGLVAADPVKYYHGGGTAVTGLTNNTEYFVSALGLAANTFRLATSAVAAAGRANLAGVAISGTGGQFTCTATTLATGDHIVFTGTAPGGGAAGSITGYTTGKIYEVSAVTGTSPNVTGFTITEEDTTAVVTTAGTPTTLTYNPYTIVMISGTGNNAQYFDLTGQVTATAVADLGSGTQATIPNPGWVRRTIGTGGRAGRVQYEVLVAGRSLITGDAPDDIALPDA
jgi:hypothetical protein